MSSKPGSSSGQQLKDEIKDELAKTEKQPKKKKVGKGEMRMKKLKRPSNANQRVKQRQKENL